MSKILITGNGFDLFHHLPTKYGHFISVMKAIESTNNYVNDKFENLFGSEFKNNYKEEYDKILEKYNTQNIQFDSSRIKELKEMISVNSWYRHFRETSNIETWIDFETEIGKVLNDFSSIFSYSRENPNMYDSVPTSNVRVYKNYYTFDFTREEISDDWINVNNLFLDGKNKKIKEKEFLTNVIKSLNDFIIIFNRYLIDIVYKFYDNKNFNFKIPMDSLHEIYTVNYTPTIEKIYKVHLTKITYLHGKSNESDSLQNLVLGISEVSEIIKDSKIYDFTKYYQRIKQSTNHKFIDIPKEKTNNNRGEKIFYIIGHSLDESDKAYIHDLFKFLEYDLKKNSKICIFYYNSSDREIKLRNLFSILDKDILIEMDKEKRLYFVELTEQNIITEFNKKLYNQSVDFSIKAT